MPDLETMVQDIRRYRETADAHVDEFEFSPLEQLHDLLEFLEHDYYATTGRKPEAFFVGGRWWQALYDGRSSTFFFHRLPIHHVELPGLKTLAGVAE